MLNIKTLHETVINMINNMHDALPEVDTKEGTFLRDVIIDPVSREISDLYNELYNQNLSQSVLTATGSDLDKLGSNYFISRKIGTVSYGKVRFYIANTDVDGRDMKYPDIRIPKGTVVSTQGTTQNPALLFQTTDDIFIEGSSTVLNNLDTTVLTGVMALPRDITGFRYVEILCESLGTGLKYNIGPYEIIAQNGAAVANIANVSNPYSFSGGSDAESDVSLALRISLAVTGSNIGTKDGYLSYILQQPQVLDAYIVGAGDPYMIRDKLTIVNPKTGVAAEQQIGGKVDIYVRTNSTVQNEFSHQITNEDLDNDFHVPIHLLFPSTAYPIERVVSIVGQVTNIDNTITYKHYVNADDYELETTSDKNIENYYVDIPWDFSIKTYFPDADYYPLPKNISNSEIMRLKNKLDNELQTVSPFLQDLSYKIEWDLINWIVTDDVNINNHTTLFQYGMYTDNLYYKLRMKPTDNDGSILGGRIFVKKEGQIYVRAYVNPDFKLVKDTGNFQGSVYAQDYISWFERTDDLSSIDPTHVPEDHELLIIKYISNNGIKELQDGLETKRVMTADVLVKSAHQKEVEIHLAVTCSPSYNPDDIKQQVSQALSYFVNNQKKLGGYIDESDIVYIARSIDGVISVDMESVSLGFIQQLPSQTISCKPDEYFYLKNLILSVTNTYNI